MDTSLLDDQQGLTYISSIQTLVAVKRTFQDSWTIGTDDESELGNSVLSAQLDDDHDHND